MRRSRDHLWIALVAPVVAIALYAGAYGIARASGSLSSVSICDSIWPCPVAILGPPAIRAAFAPAIAVETRVRLAVDAARGP